MIAMDIGRWLIDLYCWFFLFFGGHHRTIEYAHIPPCIKLNYTHGTQSRVKCLEKIYNYIMLCGSEM